MLLRKLKENSPDNIALIVVIAFAVWLISFINPGSAPSMPDEIPSMPLYGLLERATVNSPFTGVFISFLLVLLISYLMVEFNTSDIFIGERTFLPALMYLLLTGLFPHLRVINPVLPATPFLIFALKRIVSVYKVQGTAYQFFDAGLLISTGSLFYAGFIWYGLIIFIGMIIFRTGKLNEIIITVAGLIAPWFITVGVLYLTDADLGSLISGIGYSLFRKIVVLECNMLTMVTIAVIFLVLLVSLINLLMHLRTKKIKARKTFILLIWTFILSMVMILSSKAVSVEIFWLAAVPAGYFMSHYFVHSGKKKIPGILFAVMLILIAAVQISEAGLFPR